MKDKSGNLIESSSQISNVLNEYFYSVVVVVSSDTPVGDAHAQSNNTEKIHLERNGIVKLINDMKINKAPGSDGLQKNDSLLVPEIPDILAIIFQYSINTGMLPTDWRLANVVPIHKGGEKVLPNNYRPVSLTFNVCKMLKHVSLHYFSKHLQNILCTNQHGFRRGMSCNTQLITALHLIFFTIGRPRLSRASCNSGFCKGLR